MYSRLAISAFLFSLVLLFAFRFRENQQQKRSLINYTEYKKKSIKGCSPDWEFLKKWMEEVDIPPIPGAGIYKWRISTKNDSAQFYFNQGINMYYGFHIIEAMASFKKAVKFDPACAILYWAQALGYGPNINDLGYRASPEALAAVNKANELNKNASQFEKKLIEAISVRYTADSVDATRGKLNQAYTDMMKIVFEKYPSNPDAQALYADAMLLQHPWDLWFNNGAPKPWTPLIRQVLEKLLRKAPYHPGANHYYIHLMEPSPFAAKALASAARLGITNPGLSHLVHMPSHIYLRTGNYQSGIDVNIKAVNSYKKSISLFSPVQGADFLYIIHNLHMKTNNAMLSANFKISEAASFETRNSIPKDYLSIPPPLGSYVQYIYMTPVLTYIRFAKWNELLQLEEPGQNQIFAKILYHFGRGMALSHQSRFAESKYELEQIQQLKKDSSLYIPLSPFSAAIDGAIIAENLLKGTIAMKESRMPEAIEAFEKAVSTEENMVYNEPRDWMLNPNHYLGSAYLEAGYWSEAEKTFLKDLQNNQENGWALTGLKMALQKQQKNNESNKISLRIKAALINADINISSAAY